jgi:hypothetical protein
MAVPKANQRAVNKYVKNNYDRINVTMPKGRKELIQAAAAAAGESVNAYINGAINARISVEGPVSAPEVGAVSLPSEAEKTRQDGAESEGGNLNE